MSRTAANAEKTVVPATVPVRTALKQQAHSELKRLLLCGELEAGTVLSVRQLAAQLKMSKTPVQSALERLEVEGLVTLAPQQGVVVRSLSIQDIVNHYEIRQALEPFVVRRLAGRLTPEQVNLLRRNLEEHHQHARDERSRELIRFDAEFHQLLCHFLGNDEITRVMQQLRDKIDHVIDRAARQFPGTDHRRRATSIRRSLNPWWPVTASRRPGWPTNTSRRGYGGSSRTGNS